MRPSCRDVGDEEPGLADLRLVGSPASSWHARRRGPCRPTTQWRSIARSNQRSASARVQQVCPQVVVAGERGRERVELVELGVLGEQRRSRRRRRYAIPGASRAPRAGRAPAAYVERHAGLQLLEQQLADPVRATAAHHQHHVARRGPARRASARSPRRSPAPRRRCQARVRATAPARPAAEATVVSGSRPAQMSAIGHGVGRGERVGEVVEQRRGPVIGQRLVDGPDAPARLALADGGQRRADRRRMVAVVVVDHDAAAPRPCARAGGRRPRTRRGRARSPRGRGRARARPPATPSAFAALWRPAVRQAGDRRPRSSSRPSSSSVVPSRRLGRRCRPRTRSTSAPRLVAPRARSRPSRAAARSSSATATTGARPIREPADELGDARVGEVRDRASRSGAPPDPAPRTPRAPRPGRRTRRGGPTRRRSARSTSGRYGVEVAGVLVGLHDERRPGPAPRRRRHAAARQRRRQQRPDERAADPARPPPARGRASRPSCSCRACRRPRRAAGRPPRPRRPAATARAGSRPRARRRARRGPGRSPSAPWSRRGASGAWRAPDVRGVVRRPRPARRPRRAPACTGARRPGRSRRPPRRPMRPAARPQTPRPRPPRRRGSARPRAIGRAGRAGASPAPTAAAPRTVTRAPPASTRASSSSSAAPALGALVLRAVAGPQVPPHLGGRPRPATATYTSPTGFASEPPSGPATPVTPTPRSVPSRARDALGHRHRDLRARRRRGPRAPSPARPSSAPSPHSSTRHDPAEEVAATNPGTSVRRWATSPPVHDSAVATVRPRSTQRACSRAASSTSGSVGHRQVRSVSDRRVGRREQPRLGVALVGHPPEVLAVEREVRRARLARSGPRSSPWR